MTACVMSTANTVATLAASPATSRTSGISGCLSATIHEKEVDYFGLLTSEPSSSGRKRKHMEHRDIKRPSKRHAGRSRSALKLRIVRTALGYKAFPAAEPPSFEITLPVQPSPRRDTSSSLHANSILPAHDAVRDPGHGQHNAYANKIRIVRGGDGEYKAYPSSSAPPTPTEPFHSTSAA